MTSSRQNPGPVERAHGIASPSPGRERSGEELKTLPSLPQAESDQGHDSRASYTNPMPPAMMLVQTPRGSSIQKTEDGQFLVCDAENQCYFTRSLYQAEEELEGMERGYVFPYATNFRKHLA